MKKQNAQISRRAAALGAVVGGILLLGAGGAFPPPPERETPNKAVPAATLRELTPAQEKEISVILSDSWRQGLNPSRYAAQEIEKQIQQDNFKTSTDFERLIWDAAARYLQDMSGPRLKMARLGLRAEDWRTPLSSEEARAQLQSAPDPSALLRASAPQTPLYKALQNELATIRDRIEAGEGDQPIYPVKTIKRLLHPGEVSKAVPDLRDRLGGKLQPGTNPDLYDDALARVVMAFQRNHGLKDDGVIGPKTIGFFNQTWNERLRQVLANLERVRWLDPLKPSKYIVVNIPAATLWAVEGGKVQVEMPVIVGRKERPTNQFRTEVTGIRLYPTWTIPAKIKQEDFLPKLQQDPSYLAGKGIDVWQGRGKEAVKLDPTYIDWKSMSKRELSALRMVQSSGGHNALGKIRVLMPNPYNIYLHDTNTPSYFRTDDRNLSSGCVRLGNPQAIAEFVLSGQEGWGKEKLNVALAAEKTRDISLTNRFPVLILYQSAWLRTDGALVLAYDIYGEDIKLSKALAEANLIPVFSE